MFNDTKIASLIKRNSNIIGEKCDDGYYIAIDGQLVIKIHNWGDYPKIYGKLYSLGFLYGDNEFKKPGNVKKFLELDTSHLIAVRATGITVETDRIITLWDVGGKNAVAIQKKYTDAIESRKGVQHPDQPFIVYFSDDEYNVYGAVCVIKHNIPQIIKTLLPSVWQQINKAIDYDNPDKVGGTQ